MKENRFLLEFKSLLALVSQYRTSTEISMIKSFVLENQHAFTDSPIDLAFIHQLIELTERTPDDREISDFIRIATACWFACLEKETLTCIFYVSEQNYTRIIQYISPKNHHEIIWLPQSESIESVVASFADRRRVVLVYDDYAKNIETIKEQLFCAIPYYKLYRAESTGGTVLIEYLSYLQNEHAKMTAGSAALNMAVGNSHAWYALPANCTTQTVNFAMHSADLSFARAMVSYSLRTRPLENYLCFVSPFELHNELSLSRYGPNLSYFKTLKAFCQRNDIAYQYSVPHVQGMSVTNPESDIRTDLQAIIITRLLSAESRKKLKRLHREDKEKELTNKLAGYVENNELNACLALQSDNLVRAPEAIQADAIARGNSHASLVKWQHTADKNRRHLQRIATMIAAKNKKMIVVMPPYPDAYIQQFPPEMLENIRNLIQELVTQTQCVLLDFTSDRDFREHHFRDGDHLNFSGAQQLIRKLSAAGLVI